ncbi:MAG: hypothetical protein GF388_07785 [Candidatus Aegiribacteria sp.]|nr:hypothetical protein [Candidatus Aegiribacteria sp.]MBD3295017.1 hypothetical protein [Candidatus Fermentibacteria bacterium]
MIRGIVLILAMMATPEEAVRSTWSTVQDGSPRDFLYSLTSDCADRILDSCGDYLNIIRSMDRSELGHLFASLRLEAAPDEVEYWDETAVLEMLMSSPDNRYMLRESTLTIDSITGGDSLAKAYLTLELNNSHSVRFQVHLINSPLGWRTSGLQPLVEQLLEASI